MDDEIGPDLALLTVPGKEMRHLGNAGEVPPALPDVQLTAKAQSCQNGHWHPVLEWTFPAAPQHDTEHFGAEEFETADEAGERAVEMAGQWLERAGSKSLASPDDLLDEADS